MAVGLGVACAVAVADHRAEVKGSSWVAHTGGYVGDSFATEDGCLQAAQAADGSDSCTRSTHLARPAWAIPVSILVGFLGLAASVAILVRRSQSAEG